VIVFPVGDASVTGSWYLEVQLRVVRMAIGQ